jgi:predicted acylesterase/phospholipase RssA
MKGYLFLGAIKLLNEYNILPKIKHYYGTSFGAIIITCLALGWDIDELLQFSINFPIDCIIDYNIDNLINHHGLVPKENFEILFKKIIIYKGFSENTTFKELFHS